MGHMKAAKIHRPKVYYISLAQLVLLGAVALPLSMQWGTVRGYSWLLGGLVAVVTHAYFAWQVFRYRGAQAARRIASASYAGEIGKFLLAVAGFALIFALVRPVSGGAVFAGYGVMLIVQLSGSWLLLRQPVSQDKS